MTSVIRQARGEAVAREIRRLGFRQTHVQGVELLFGDLCGHTRPQPHDRIDHPLAGGVDGERQPDGVVAVPPEPGRHDADHGVGLIVEKQFLAEGARIAVEQTLPDQVAEHHHGFLEVRRQNRSAQDGLDSEKLERVGGQEHTLKALRAAVAGEEHSFSGGRHRLGKGGQLGHLQVLAHPVRAPSLSRLEAADSGRPDLVRLGVRIWFQQHAVHDAEDCGGGADPQSQRQQGHRRRTRSFPKAANCVAQILPHAQ